MYDEYYNESKRSGGIHNIENSCVHLYAHLMKFISVKPILTGWVGTIIEHLYQLSRINNQSYWRNIHNNQAKLNDIRRKAIKEYEKDGNKNGDIQFNVVYNNFYSILLFRDIKFVKLYLINHCDNDENMISYINNKFYEKFNF